MDRYTLATKLADATVDAMDIGELMDYAHQQLTRYYDSLTPEELIAETKEYHPDLLEE